MYLVKKAMTFTLKNKENIEQGKPLRMWLIGGGGLRNGGFLVRVPVWTEHGLFMVGREGARKTFRALPRHP